MRCHAHPGDRLILSVHYTSIVDVHVSSTMVGP